MIRYLFLDCEMGGRELKYSLLTAAFVVMDDQFNVIGELDLKVKPDDGDYIVSGQGMGVNRIDLVQHDAVATPYKAAKSLLYNFLKEMSMGKLGSVKLTPVGHGVKGDIDHILKYLISEGSWEQFCTYHYIDTSVVLQFLRARGEMPYDVEGSLGALARYFCPPNTSINDIVPGLLHEAMFDTKLTAFVYQNMLMLGKKFTKPS